MIELNSDSELLVHRFLDQELSAEERLRLLTRLGRDEALRHRLIELEQLALEVSRLPRPEVPDRFVSDAVERARRADRESAQPPTHEPSVWERLSEVLWAPRALRWNLASASVLCLAVLAAGGIGSRYTRWRPVPVGGASDPQLSSVPAPSSVLVRFVFVQPGARSVQVAGDFNGWNPGRTSLEEVSDGAWAVTIPLPPGRYEYMFVVDGQAWISDPFAAEHNDDGFGSQNAVLDVRPPAEGLGARL